MLKTMFNLYIFNIINIYKLVKYINNSLRFKYNNT